MGFEVYLDCTVSSPMPRHHVCMVRMLGQETDGMAREQREKLEIVEQELLEVRRHPDRMGITITCLRSWRYAASMSVSAKSRPLNRSGSRVASARA